MLTNQPDIRMRLADMRMTLKPQLQRLSPWRGLRIMQCIVRMRRLHLAELDVTKWDESLYNWQSVNWPSDWSIVKDGGRANSVKVMLYQTHESE